MSNKTLTRAELVEAVVTKIGLPRQESAELVEAVLQEITTTLANGEPVKLSSFGSFGIREKRQRIGRNPKTGEEVPITPRKVVVFRASNIMKESIDSTIKRDKGAGKAKRKPAASKAASASASGGGGGGAKTARGKAASGKSAGGKTAKSRKSAGTKKKTTRTTRGKGRR